MREKLIIAIASILITFVMLEVVARIFVGVKTVPEIERMQLDSTLGWRWTPNYEATITSSERPYFLKISAQGLRNEPVTIPKPRGQRRIMALGDSITAGLGVELEETFAKQLQQSLAVEVVNAGVDDYGLEQELLWLERDGVQFEPDLVILEVYLNDSRSFSKSSWWVTTLNNLLLNRSAFYNYYYRWVIQLRVQQSQQDPFFRFRFEAPVQSGQWRTDPEAVAQVIDSAADDFGLAWKQSEIEKLQTLMRKFALSAEQNKFALLVVFFPVSIQVESKAAFPTLDQPQQRLTEFAKSEHIAFLDLLPVLRHHAEDGLYIDHAHLTPYGHRVVAEAIEAALANQP